MTNPVVLALWVTPLAVYLYLVAVWHAGRHPRVVEGAVDLWLLALGLGGLLLFGPFGQLLARMLFRRPGPLHWVLLTLVGVLVVGRLARGSARRLVIYHVEGVALDAALSDALGSDRFVRTLSGYEDRAGGRGVRVDHSPRWQSAVVEGYGYDAGALIAALGPRLRERLNLVPAVTTEVALVFFGLSALTMLAPLAGHLLAQPRTRAALRVLLERLQGV